MTMKKTYRSRLIKLVALILPIVLFWLVAENFLFYHTERNSDRFRRFYNEEPNSIDVVFLGASEVFAGYAPGYAYDQFGYTSYIYVTDANVGSLYKPQLKEVLAHQDPQIVFVETFGFLRGNDTSLISEDRMRLFTESIPLSRNKVETVLEYPCDHKLSYFIPFLKYHAHPGLILDNIRALMNDPMYLDRKAPSQLKGISTICVSYDGPGDPGRPDDPAAHVLSPEAEAYLIDFLEYCKEEKLDNIVFINFPRYLENEADHDLMSLVAQVEKIAGEYGYPLVNLQGTNEVTGLDEKTDFYNSHHMNVCGQRKITKHIGNLVMNTYGITPTAQSPEAAANWQAAARSTQEFFELAERYIREGQAVTLQENENVWIFRQNK